MKSFKSILVLSLTCLATQTAQAQWNTNVVNGNGNTIVNGGRPRQQQGFVPMNGFQTHQPVRNINQVNGHNNMVVNGGGFRQAAHRPVIVGGHPSTWSPTPQPVIVGGHPSTWSPTTVHQVHYPQPRPQFQPQRRASNPLGIPININYNSVKGNSNTVVNGPRRTKPKDVAIDVLGQFLSGSAQRNGLNININKVRGNRNRVINNP